MPLDCEHGYSSASPTKEPVACPWERRLWGSLWLGLFRKEQCQLAPSIQSVPYPLRLTLAFHLGHQLIGSQLFFRELDRAQPGRALHLIGFMGAPRLRLLSDSCIYYTCKNCIGIRV